MQGLLILVAHCVGDYLIQNDWMAQNKKKSSLICGFHVATYMIPFILCNFTWWQMGLIYLQHFFQDRTDFVIWFMNKTGKKDFASPPMSPWSIFVVDNTFHLAWILLVVWPYK